MTLTANRFTLAAAAGRLLGAKSTAPLVMWYSNQGIMLKTADFELSSHISPNPTFREDSIALMAIPKHASFYVQTAQVPFALLEAAANDSKASG